MGGRKGDKHQETWKYRKSKIRKEERPREETRKR